MGLGADTFCFVRCSRYGLCGVRIGEASHLGPPRVGVARRRDVVDELPTKVPASQSPAPEEPSTGPPTFRGLADGRHEQRVFSMASSDGDADGKVLPLSKKRAHVMRSVPVVIKGAHNSHAHVHGGSAQEQEGPRMEVVSVAPTNASLPTHNTRQSVKGPFDGTS